MVSVRKLLTGWEWKVPLAKDKGATMKFLESDPDTLTLRKNFRCIY
jgi:hypothetical protein